jgi:tRNA(Ile)-lysidine synthetase-like protein
VKSIISILKNELHIPTSSTLVLSVSGGVDSMVMLHMLKDSPYRLVVTHFNHLKRDQSMIEKDLVENYTKSLEIPFHYYTIKVKEGNFHHQAHILREHYLKEVANLYETPYILTAHHLDDLFENILIKMTRGSNLLGYAGMQQVNEATSFTYIKPLLYFSKKEIKSYAEENEVAYLDDESNEENMYLRNRYRHSVVPIMKQENETLLDQMKQYHSQLSNAFFFIRKQTKTHVQNNHIDLNLFKTWDPALQDDAIAYIIENAELNISYEIIQKIKRMLLSSKPNVIYRLNKNHPRDKRHDEYCGLYATNFHLLKYLLQKSSYRSCPSDRCIDLRFRE